LNLIEISSLPKILAKYIRILIYESGYLAGSVGCNTLVCVIHYYSFSILILKTSNTTIAMVELRCMVQEAVHGIIIDGYAYIILFI
jgi:hypothetical protein